MISARTKEALRARRASGLPVGRPKGPGKSKLDKHRPEIEALLANGSTQKFIATRKLADEARNQETKSVKSYGGFGTFEPLGPSIRLNPFPVGPMSQVEKPIANFSYQKLITKLPNLVLCDIK